MDIISYRDILNPDCLDKIRSILEDDGVVVYPTDTLYGLGGNFFSKNVGHKIDTLKGRSDMPYSVAVSGLKMLGDLVKEIPEQFYQLYKSILPGKFTMLFNVSPDIDRVLVKQSPKIGIRIPGEDILLEMIERLKIPLISTSVNRTGQPPLRDPVEIREKFPDADLLIDAGVLEESAGSTIIDLTKSPIEIIRKGDEFHRLNRFIHLFKT